MNRGWMMLVVALFVVVGATVVVRAQDQAVPVQDVAPPVNVPVDWSGHNWTGAGTPLPPADPSIEAMKTGDLAYLWAFEGNVGTYVDGCTQIELLPGPDVKVLKNCVRRGYVVGAILGRPDIDNG